MNSKNEYNSSPFHCICKNKQINIEILKYFVNNKANLNSKNNMRDTPLHYLCGNEKASFKMIQYLILNKSNINAKNPFYEIPFFGVKNISLKEKLKYRN